MVRTRFSVAGAGGAPKCADAITRCLDRMPRPVRATIASPEQGLGELGLRLVCFEHEAVTEATSNEHLHVALRLDSDELELLRKLGWLNANGIDGGDLAGRHLGDDSIYRAVLQVLDTLDVFGFEADDELELTMTSGA